MDDQNVLCVCTKVDTAIRWAVVNPYGHVLDSLDERSGVRRFMDSHPGQTAIVCRLNIADTVGSEREKYNFDYHTRLGQSSLRVYRELNPEYQIADYLRHVACYLNKRLFSRLKCGCFGLQVDIGRFDQISRDCRVCQVCYAKF